MSSSMFPCLCPCFHVFFYMFPSLCPCLHVIGHVHVQFRKKIWTSTEFQKSTSIDTLIAIAQQN
jgi:hypothetical protein